MSNEDVGDEVLVGVGVRVGAATLAVRWAYLYKVFAVDGNGKW